MNSNTRFILSIMAAAAVGVAIGMLLAPEKGSDLRKSLKRTMDDLGNDLNDFVSEGKDRIMDAADNLRHATEDIKQDMQTTIDHGKKVTS